MAEKELKLPQGCLCYQCPNYENCLAMSQKIFSTAENFPQDAQFVLKKFEKVVKDDPLTLVCSLGGFFLGAAFSEWLKRSYKPRRRRI